MFALNVLSGGQVQGAALGTQAAKVGRMIRVALHIDNAAVLRFDQYAATGSTVRAGGACLGGACGGHAATFDSVFFLRRLRPGGAHSRFAKHQRVAPITNAGPFSDQAEVIAAVGGVPIQAGPNQAVTLDDQLLVDLA